MSAGTNLHLFMSPCTHESRLLKEATTLIDHRCFDQVVVIGLAESGLAGRETIDKRVHVERIVLRSRALPKNLLAQAAKYLEWLIRAALRGRHHKPGVIHVHSLPALPLGVLVSLICSAPLIYDAHELETEQDNSRGLRQRLARWVERRLIGRASKVLVVSDSIADWYRDTYRIDRPAVLRNVPARRQAGTIAPAPLRERLGLSEQDLLFIYQGSLAPGRGVERLLRVFARRSDRKHIVFMGYGSLVEEVRAQSKQSSNIHFQPAVSPAEVLSYTAAADVGMCLIENTCLSYYYSLPNKLFEYLSAGLPVVINDFPEQRRIVDSFGCGWLVDESDESLAEMIESLQMDMLMEKRAAARIAGQKLTWQSESEVLLRAYRALP